MERARALLALSHLSIGVILHVRRVSSWMLLASLTGTMGEKVLGIILQRGTMAGATGLLMRRAMVLVRLSFVRLASPMLRGLAFPSFVCLSIPGVVIILVCRLLAWFGHRQLSYRVCHEPLLHPFEEVLLGPPVGHLSSVAADHCFKIFVF